MVDFLITGGMALFATVSVILTIRYVKYKGEQKNKKNLKK